MLVNIDTATSAVYVLTSSTITRVLIHPFHRYSAKDFKSSAMEVCGFRNVRELTMDANHPKYHILRKFLQKVRIYVRTIGAGRRPKMVYDIIPNAGKYEFTMEDGSTINITVSLGQIHSCCPLIRIYCRIIIRKPMD